MSSQYRISQFMMLLCLGLTACGSGVGVSTSEAKSKMSPTIYYLPVIDMEKETCAASTKKSLKDVKGQLLAKVCSNSFQGCAIQGSCYLKLKDQYKMINFARLVGGEHRFQLIKTSNCPYAYGFGNTCMDPYYSVAADQEYYPLGTVIYVDGVIGTILPDGTAHSGYFIVRDKGGGVNGAARFDFYTGTLHPYDMKNSLAAIGLGDPDNRFTFRVIKGAAADQFIRSRNYPSLIPSVYKSGLKSFNLKP